MRRKLRRSRLRQIHELSRDLGNGTVVVAAEKHGAPLSHGSVSVGLGGTSTLIVKNPTTAIAERISDALDVTKAPSKGRTFADMTEAEREEMRRLYARGGR